MLLICHLIILPSNYPETVEFLIKNLEHKIENNKWVTTLDSYCISKGEYTETVSKNINPQGQSKPSSTTTNPPSPSNGVRTVNAKYPNVNFKDGVVRGSTPSKDPIKDSLLRDISKAAVDAGVVVSITTAISGHKSTPPSRHTAGDAVDIAIIDGIAVNPRASNRAKIDEFVAALQRLGYKKNVEKGNPKALLTFGFANHDDHVHVSNRI